MLIQTARRPQIMDLDSLPIIDRSLIDWSRYHRFIGHAGVRYSMAVQATRGCPYRCFYCDIYKTNKNHVRRSTDNVFNEVKILHDIGVRRIEFIDDIFNVNKKQFIRFFELVLKNRLNLQFFFPTGLRGDLLDRPTIDLMVEAGAVGVNLSLEHAAPRMQGIMRKHLKVEQLRENLHYITEKHPTVVLTLNAMHGFPTETEVEAMQTLDFIREIKWIDFPYLHNVRIFPGTELERFALESGIDPELIRRSQDMSYHENAPTLPFSDAFSRQVRTLFLRDYVLNRERLLHVLRRQLRHFTEDELDQKYNSYFPNRTVRGLKDLLRLARIDPAELADIPRRSDEDVRIPDLSTRLAERFAPPPPPRPGALKLLLVDYSSHFEGSDDQREYAVLEPPLGLMAVLSYVRRELGDQVDATIVKPRIDFNSHTELLALVHAQAPAPDLIGIRAMTFYKRFMHDGVAHLRNNGITAPVIIGGPYASESFAEALNDPNIDIAAIGEGEETLTEVLRHMIANNNRLPDRAAWAGIQGIAFKGAP